MKRFKNILVGVDLSWGDWLVADELSPPNQEAVRQANWLAKLNGANLHFLYSLDLSARAAEMLAADQEATLLDQAREQLGKLSAESQAEGINATSEVVIGRSWLALIERVLRNNHDLLIVGTRHFTSTQGMLFGSTGIKLLRKCPCAVWVTQPWSEKKFDSILVAHDLRPVGDLALELGAAMAALQGAHLHVIHAAEREEIKLLMAGSESAEKTESLRQATVGHITRQLQKFQPQVPADVHFSLDSPTESIERCVAEYDADLLVMGTLGRAGISGLVIGNTAERLLPRISCSLLAVKPPDFVSPVSLPS